MKKEIIVVLVIVFLVGACLIIGSGNKKVTYEITDELIQKVNNHEYDETEEISNYIKIDVKDYGEITAILYEEAAPITVKNFQKLVSEHFYDNLIFHRVINDFMIQGGWVDENSLPKTSETIKGEFSANGVKNNLKHTRGALSMARRGGNPETSETMNSASSQFFIVHKDYPSLNGNYAAFGKVITGIEVVDKIAIVDTDENDKPITNVVINSIRFIKIKGE